jgi:hypothetical protein
MSRARHAMRVHPLRSKGVVVGVPVAAAVAFGAHSVLGITPVSDQHDAPSSTAGSPQASGPVQSYGLAQSPPPTTLGLLSAPSAVHPTGTAEGGTASGTTASSAPAVQHGGTSTPHSVPITPAAAPAAPAPTMLSFPSAAAPATPAAAPAATAAAAPQAAAPQQRTAEAPAAATTHDDGGSSNQQQSSGGGSLLGVDLGVAKVSVLSFGQ